MAQYYTAGLYESWVGEKKNRFYNLKTFRKVNKTKMFKLISKRFCTIINAWKEILLTKEEFNIMSMSIIWKYKETQFYVERISNTEIEIMSLNKIWIAMTNNRKTYNGWKRYNAYEKRWTIKNRIISEEFQIQSEQGNLMLSI